MYFLHVVKCVLIFTKEIHDRQNKEINHGITMLPYNEKLQPDPIGFGITC